MIEKVGTLEAGGTITGDLVVEGDLTVEGSSTYTYDELVEGGIVIDTTDAEAFLVRKASDGGDVFTVDSSDEIIQINSHDGSTKGLKLGATLVTSTASELNILDGATLSTAELNYVDGVTSAIQTQLDAKAPTASPTFTGTITIGSAEISETELEILDGATVTTAELNILDGVTATATELNYLDITTLGTVEASKVVTADASGNINFNNGNMTNVDIDSGAIDGADITVGSGKTLDVSSGTLTLGANQISGDKVDGGTISDFASTGIDDNAVSNALTIDSSQNLAITSGTLEVYSNITTGAGNRDISLTPHGTGEVDVNATLDADALKINGTLVSATATELNVLDGITSSTAELNILDGVTSNASELNVLDGVTGFIDDDTMGTASATTIASAESIKAYADAQDANVASDTMTFTNKTFDVEGTGNSISNIDVADLKSGVLDIDLSSVSASDDTLASAKAIKAYVDAQDHDASDESVGGDLSGTVSSATIINDAVTYAKMQNVSATDRILGRDTAGAGDVEEITPANVRTMINVEDGATADQTDAEIRTAVENATDSNVFTDADHSKLDGIEASADVTDTANVTSAGALMDSELTSITDVKALDQSVVSGASPTFTTTNFTDATNKRLMTDAQETKLDSVESSADVTDATNVASAGAVMESDTTTASMSFVVDEDDMASNSATKLASQQSIKAYVDSVAQGLNVKTACAVATTANITLSGEQTIDGVATSTSRVLVKDQTDASENGIYVSASGAWSRATDLDAPQEVASSFVFITSGTNNADTGWVCTNEPESVTVGTDDITFSQFSDAGHITSGTGLTKTGNTLSVNASQTQITSVGELDAGSITSNFGSINNGSSTITTTGAITGGSFVTGTLTVDDGSITDSDGAISFGDENLSTTGTLSAGQITGTSFVIGSADIGETELEILDGATVTTDELNLIDGGTARGTTAVASGDGILINDGGTMRMTNVDTVSTYFASHNVGGSNIVTTGALNSGSITSGFGAIDNGSSTANFGATTVDSLSVSDGNITNVGDISLDSISSDAGTSINVVLGSDAGDDFTVDTSKLVVEGDTGNVGIGTTSPNTMLHVDAASGTTYPTLGTASGVLGLAINELHGMYLGVDGSSGNGWMQVMREDGTGTAYDLVLQPSGGNVGIGTSSPSLKTHIVASSDTDGLLIHRDSTSINNECGLYFAVTDSPATRQKGAILFERTIAGGGYGVGSMHFALDSTQDNANVTISDTKMTIDKDGNVGIGTTSPSSMLHLVSSVSENPYIIIENTNADVNAPGLKFNKNSSSPADGDELGNIIWLGDDDAGNSTGYTQIVASAADVTNGTEDGSLFLKTRVNDSMASRLSIVDGNVGIGTDNPGYHLQIEGDTTTLYAKSSTDNHIKFEGSSTGKSNRIEFYNNTQSWFVGQPDSGNYSGNGTDFYIGAATNTPMFMIDTSGDSYTNDGSISNLSDKRGKKDIVDLEDGLDIVKQLKPVTYKHNGLIWGTDDGVTRYGFVADDILEVASQYVNIKDGTVGDEEVYDLKSISMMRMFPMLVKAVQELSAKVEALENA